MDIDFSSGNLEIISVTFLLDVFRRNLLHRDNNKNTSKEKRCRSNVLFCVREIYRFDGIVLILYALLLLLSVVIKKAIDH